MAASVLFGLGHHNEASTRRVERRRTPQSVPASTADSSGCGAKPSGTAYSPSRRD